MKIGAYSFVGFQQVEGTIIAPYRKSRIGKLYSFFKIFSYDK